LVGAISEQSGGGRVQLIRSSSHSIKLTENAFSTDAGSEGRSSP
jgi:hypothetical protein